ncbi:MAG TPA: septum formation initiator family protein [Solirubrobacteraceae bacterium]
MAAARARQQPHPHRRPVERRSPRAVPAPRVSASGIRWDRVGRVGLLLVLVVILGLYVGPARSYFATRSQAAEKRQAVERLRGENARLKNRVSALKDPGELEREARRMGMVRPGERAYVVKGLPRGE